MVTWHADALCANRPDLDPVFFPEKGGNAKLNAEVREFCGNCPVQSDCLAEALRIEGDTPAIMRYGVRAGLTPGERARLQGIKAPEGTGPRRTRPDFCQRCDRPVRGEREPNDGRARYAARGVCSGCYAVLYRRKSGAA